MTEETGPVYLGPSVPDEFDVRRVVVTPGAERLFVEAEWRDAIVVVESGGLELESSSGPRWRFGRGDVLWLIGLPLRALRAGRADRVDCGVWARGRCRGGTLPLEKGKRAMAALISFAVAGNDGRPVNLLVDGDAKTVADVIFTSTREPRLVRLGRSGESV